MFKVALGIEHSYADQMLRHVSLIIAFSLSLRIWALGASNGYVPHAKGAVTAKELKAMRASLGSAQCIYGNLGDRIAMTEWDPQVFEVPKPCGSTTGDKDPLEHRPICVGTVICRTQTVHFIVEKAVCWATNTNLCPPPSKCAEASLIKSFDTFSEPGALVEMPVYMTTQPARSSQ